MLGPPDVTRRHLKDYTRLAVARECLPAQGSRQRTQRGIAEAVMGL